MLWWWVYMFKYACCDDGYTCSSMHTVMMGIYVQVGMLWWWVYMFKYAFNVVGNKCLGIHAVLMVIYAHYSNIHTELIWAYLFKCKHYLLMGIHVQLCMLCWWVYMFKYACCDDGYTCSSFHTVLMCAHPCLSVCIFSWWVCMFTFAYCIKGNKCSSVHAVLWECM